MSSLGQRIERQAQRARNAERFVRLIVGGGVALAAGLWVATLAVRWSPFWIAGVVLVLLGVAGLASGIWREIEV